MARVYEAYSSPSASLPLHFCIKVACFLVVALGLFVYLESSMAPAGSGGGTMHLKGMHAGRSRQVRAVTWNVAAINNNPFEYWISSEDRQYTQLMGRVSDFIEHPGARDVQVEALFTEDMFLELEGAMKAAGWGGVEETRKLWESDFKGRKIISGFLKDPVLGKKRLASMPDRVTNTINTLSGEKVMRPTVINCYSGNLGTIKAWWKQYMKFFFKTEISIKKKGEVKNLVISSMLSPIKRSKYPALSEEEEKISIPLQTLCGAIFDAILVHMMNEISAGAIDWQQIRTDICLKLNSQKSDRTVEILEYTYGDADIQFLQEVAGNFDIFVADKGISRVFDVYHSADMDTERDQNSYILLKKGRFRDIQEVTEAVISNYNANNAEKLPVVKGDLVAMVAFDSYSGTKYLLASFHGDTNGLATIPVVTAVKNYATSQVPDCKLLFGLDANTYARPEKDQQGVGAFAEYYRANKLNSCYGPHPNPLNFTTFHARTHLQPQLNKAVTAEEKDIKGDKNPKDFILFFESDYQVLTTTKDNTGNRKYEEGMVFPTLQFPSDHGITATVLQEL